MQKQYVELELDGVRGTTSDSVSRFGRPGGNSAFTGPAPTSGTVIIVDGQPRQQCRIIGGFERGDTRSPVKYKIKRGRVGFFPNGRGMSRRPVPCGSDGDRGPRAGSASSTAPPQIHSIQANRTSRPSVASMRKPMPASVLDAGQGTLERAGRTMTILLDFRLARTRPTQQGTLERGARAERPADGGSGLRRSILRRPNHYTNYENRVKQKSQKIYLTGDLASPRLPLMGGAQTFNSPQDSNAPSTRRPFNV